MLTVHPRARFPTVTLRPIAKGTGAVRSTARPCVCATCHRILQWHPGTAAAWQSWWLEADWWSPGWSWAGYPAGWPLSRLFPPAQTFPWEEERIARSGDWLCTYQREFMPKSKMKDSEKSRWQEIETSTKNKNGFAEDRAPESKDSSQSTSFGYAMRSWDTNKKRQKLLKKKKKQFWGQPSSLWGTWAGLSGWGLPSQCDSLRSSLCLHRSS